MQWYRGNQVHKELVKKYYGGGLSSFSAMLASLKPTDDRPIRWDVRCRNCRCVVIVIVCFVVSGYVNKSTYP